MYSFIGINNTLVSLTLLQNDTTRQHPTNNDDNNNSNNDNNKKQSENLDLAINSM